MKTPTTSTISPLPFFFLLLSLFSLLSPITAQSTTTPAATTARPATTTTPVASRTTAAAASSSSAVGAGVPLTVSFSPVAQATACSTLRLAWTIPSSVPRALVNSATLDLWVTNQGVDQDTSASASSSSSGSVAAVTPVINLNNIVSLLPRAVPTGSSIMNWNFTYTPAINLVYNIGLLTLPEGRYYIYATEHTTTDQVGRTGVFSVVEGSNTACLAGFSSASSSAAGASSTARASSTGGGGGGAVTTSADAPAGTGASSTEGTTPSSSSNAATIGGAVGGVLGGLVLLGLLGFCCYRRRKQNRGSWVTPGTKNMFKDPESSGWKEGFSNLGGAGGKNGHKRSSTRSTFWGLGAGGVDGGDKEMGERSGDTSGTNTWRSQNGNGNGNPDENRSPFAGGSDSSHGGHNNFGIALGGDEDADNDEKYGLGRNGVNELGQVDNRHGGERAIELNSMPALGKSTGSNPSSSGEYHSATTGSGGSHPALSHEYVLPQPSPTHATTFAGIPHLAGYSRRDSPPRETAGPVSPPRQQKQRDPRHSGETVSSPSKSYDMHSSTPLSPQSGFDASNSNNINMNASTGSDEVIGSAPGSRKVSRSDSSASATLGKMGGNSSPPVTYPGFPHAPQRRGSVKRKPVPSIEGNDAIGLGVGWQAGAGEGEKFYDAYDGAGGEEVLDEKQRAEFAQLRSGGGDHGSVSGSRPQSGYQHNPKRSASQGSLNRLATPGQRSREGSVSNTPKQNVGSPALSQMGGKRGSFLLMPDRPLSQTD